MKDRKAEACRRSADEVRKVAHNADTVHVREAFQCLADGYDVLAEQLEQIARRSGANREDDLTWLLSSPRPGRNRQLEH
jgi:hypothetical protein